MISFSSDRDILKYEPMLFGEMHLAGQLLCKADSGQISGTGLSDTQADFIAAGVKAGGVVWLENSDSEMAFEIVSVDSATELTVSILRGDEDAGAIAAGLAGDVSYRISTFEAQANEVFLELTHYFGIGPGDSESEYAVDDIVDVSVLRQVSVFAVLAGIFATMAGGDKCLEDYWVKSMHYRRLFEKARRVCRISIDADGSGTSDSVLSGNNIKLIRG